MTLKQRIAEEFLACGDEPDALQEVFDRHSRTKGPLYSALASATAEVRHRLEGANEQTESVSSKRDSLEDEVHALEYRKKFLVKTVQNLDQEIQDRLSEVGEYGELLEQANRLEKLGMGLGELEYLQEVLLELTKGKEIAADELVPQFIKVVASCGPKVLEISQAKAKARIAKEDAEEWELQANRNEETCLARCSTIDAVGRLLDLGISEEDLTHWQNILHGAGTTAEELSGSLEHYGSLEALVEARQHKADELQGQIPRLESQVQALTAQRNNAGAAVQAVREMALKEVTEAGRQAVRAITEAGEEAQRVVEALHTAGMNYGDLREEAAQLKEYVMVARALTTEDAEIWQAFPNQVIRHVVNGVLAWTQEEGRNIQLSPPATLRYKAGLSSFTRLSLSELLLWAMTGIFTEEERTALSTPT